MWAQWYACQQGNIGFAYAVCLQELSMQELSSLQELSMQELSMQELSRAALPQNHHPLTAPHTTTGGQEGFFGQRTTEGNDCFLGRPAGTGNRGPVFLPGW